MSRTSELLERKKNGTLTFESNTEESRTSRMLSQRGVTNYDDISEPANADSKKALQTLRETGSVTYAGKTYTMPVKSTPSSSGSKSLLLGFTNPGGGDYKSVDDVLDHPFSRGVLDAIISPDNWLSTTDAEMGLKSWSGQLDDYQKELTSLSSNISNAENRLKSMQGNVNTEADVAEYNKLYDNYEALVNDYNSLVNEYNRVREKYAVGVDQYRSILNSGMDRAEAAAKEIKKLEAENSRLQQQVDLIKAYDTSGLDMTGTYAEPIEAEIRRNAQRIKELRAEENQNKMQYYSSLALMDDYAELSAPGKVTGDERYYYINDIDNARYKNEHTTDPGGEPIALRLYQHLTDDERKIYNYLYASKGKEAADRFLDDIGDTLRTRQGAAQYEQLGTLGKALYWIPAGLEQFGSGIKQLFQSEALPVSPTLITSQLIQQEAQEKSPVLGTLYELGTTLSNMAPSILAGALGGWALGAAGLSASTATAIARGVGAATLGASAGGNAYTQKINEGYSPEAARNYSTLVGASEGALQYLLGGIGALSRSGVGSVAAKIAGLDNALGRVARTVSGSTAARLLGSMISEGTEEGLQELLEPAFAAIIFDEEYEADFEDAAYAFLLGALSAGIIEGPAAIAYARRPAGFSFRDMDGYADNGVDYFEGANTLEEVEARYRDLARQYHPDVGGDTDIMAEINRQRTMARAFFRGRAEAAQEAAPAQTEEQAGPQSPDAEEGIIRRLNAPASTTEQKAAPAANPATQTEQVSGIVLPTAEDAGDFTPRAAAEAAPTLEVSRAAAPEISAVGNIVLPTADDTMIGGMTNGQHEGRQQGLGGGVGRDADIGPSGQTGRLDRGAGRRAAPAEQSRAALARQNSAKDLRLEPVSSAELGIPEGTDTRNVRVLPREDWDDALLGTAKQVQSVTGRGTRFVLGSIEVRTTDGGTHRVRGVWRPEGDIIIQADNLRVSPRQIADHEIYHELAAQNPGLDADVEARIREQFSEEEFGRVVESYIQKLRGVIDLPENASEVEFEAAMTRVLQEIYADAYAGINAFGARADRFTESARAAVQKRTGIGRETEEARRDSTGPPEERYSYAGVNAAAADLEALDVAERQTTSEEPRRQTAPDVDDEVDKAEFELTNEIMLPTAATGVDVRFSEDEDDQPVKQAISSAKTSIRQVPALFKDKNARFGEINVDVGGGRFDLATDYLAERGTRNLIFDPYNRDEATNRATLDFLRAGNRADTATNANVLNVVAEAPARANIILEAAKSIKPDGTAYFTVYEGDGSGIGRETSAGWQNNRKTADYMDEIRQYFDAVERRGKLIIAREPKTDLPPAAWEVQPGNAIRYSTEEDDQWSDDNLDKTDYEGAELSQEQADFFKDSKIRLDQDGDYWFGNGKLIPVYHSTWSDEFTVFDPAYLGRNTDSNASDEWLGATAHTGFWFNTQNLSEQTTGGVGNRAEKVYLNIKEPYELEGVVELADTIYDRAEADETAIEAAQRFVRELKESGYDGMVIKRDREFGGMSFVAFEPNQIKRVTNQNPTANADIRYSLENGPAITGVNNDRPRPVVAKQDLRRRLLDTFSVPPGSRAELGRIIEDFADKMIRSGRYTEQDRSALFDKLYDAGAMTLTADPYYSDARGALVKRRMYVSDALKAEFGDDWNDFRKRAFAAGIYLTNNPSDMAPDMWQAELGETLPGLFDSDNLDMRSFMERVVQVAEEGRDEQVSLAEYTQMLAGENYVSEDEILQDLEQRVDWELRTFAEKADLEVRLRGRGTDGITNTERKRIIQEERANYWQLHKQYQEETRQRIAEERGKRHASEREAREKINNIIREEREKYWQKRRDYQQRADERVRQERERRWAAQAETRRRIDDVEQAERRTYYERLERYKEARRATDARERERRKQMAERRRETVALRDLQQRTLKQIQWLAKNQYRAPAELKQQWDEVLGDLDIFAVSAANEMNYSKKYDATWRDLAEMYKKARDSDPNFLPSQELERIVARLDNEKIGNLDIGALQDLYKAAVGLRTEFYNRNRVIGDEEGRLFAELYADSKAEIIEAPGGYTGNPADKVFNIEQLTPMNYLERMAGWNPDSAWYSMAKQLEKGERDERAYIVRANKLLSDWLRDNEDWVMQSDGQGKNAVWYEVEVPELLELGMGDKPVFGDSVKVYMTPSMKVHLYLESKNYDNLRHMVGGRTFPDKELYSDGKRQEAFAQGKTIRLAPETVRKLVSDLTPEERELAALLERYYNQFAAERINKVSNALYGYDRAVTKNYAPIYTNSNYNQKEIGKSDQTAEGVGNMKQRIRGAKNPSYNLSAYDAFERHVDQTARFVGMAIPARNWKTLLNWRERNDSMSDVITHKWGNESLTYITDLLTDLQGGSPRKAKFQISSFADKLWSNYISAVFGANPSIVLKQLGSIPLGGAYLGMNNVPSPGQIANIDRELISRYTSELDWRLMGYATPETKQLKDHPNWTQRNSFFRNVFGGGAITGMDGWAASTLWPWAENKVRREQPELEVGTQEQIDAGQSPFYKAVAAEFDNAVNRSQSMSDTLHNARIRKSDNAVLRTLTMFKSDAAQTYNAFRQTIGEAQYYKRKEADSKTQRVARAATGAAFLAWIINAAWTAGVNFLVNLAKKKGANYRDDEDELTAQSVLGNMASDMLNGMSGVVILGEELAGAIGSAITGERWYGLDTPGIEQLNDTLESLINSGNSIKGLLSDAINIGRQGGDVLAYLNEHRADLAGGIKEVAATAVTYFPGLPVNNVEAYLAGLLSWTFPSLSTSYEDLFETPDKASLKGLEGDALVTRVENILASRLEDVSEPAAQTVATLFAAGYSEALPSGIPKQVTVTDKKTDTSETVELDAYQQQFFGQVWTETIGRAVNELVLMPEFEAASPEDQAKVLSQIYRFANETAKAETVEKYSPPSTMAEAAEDIASGRTLAEWAAYDVLSDDVSGTFGKLTDEGLDYEQALDVAETLDDLGDDATSVERYLAVARMPIPEDEKELALRGVMTDSAYAKYETARNAGIDTLDYCEFLDRISDISGDSRQERVWALIDSMRLTNRQKDMLHLAAGYKDSTLSKTPWHN